MNTIRIQVEVDTLVGIRKTNGLYSVDVFASKADGTSMSPNIPGNTSFQTTPVGNIFTLDIPVQDATYSYPTAEFTLRFYPDNSIYPNVDEFILKQAFAVNNVEGSVSNDDEGANITTVANREVRIINSQKLVAEVVPVTGAIRLIFNDVERSLDGNRDVNAFLVNYQQVEVTPIERAAFKSQNGLLLGKGDHHYYIYYASPEIATTWDQVEANSYTLFGDDTTKRMYSRRMESLVIEIN